MLIAVSRVYWRNYQFFQSRGLKKKHSHLKWLKMKSVQGFQANKMALKKNVTKNSPMSPTSRIDPGKQVHDFQFTNSK